MAVITEKRCFNLWKKVIVPELLCRTRDKSNDDQNGERTYCICKKTYDENRSMIGCDNCDKWDHLDCLKLKALPKVLKII